MIVLEMVMIKVVVSIESTNSLFKVLYKDSTKLNESQQVFWKLYTSLPISMTFILFLLLFPFFLNGYNNHQIQ